MKSDIVDANPKDEIVILELIAVIAEAWKLLVFVPILVAIVVFSIFYFSPKQYEATASIALSTAQAERIGKPAFFDDLVGDLSLSDLRRDLKITAADAAGNVTIVANRPTASAAEDLIHNVVTEAQVEIDDLAPNANLRHLASDLAAAKENENILRTALTHIQNSADSAAYDVRELLILAEEIRISTVRRENVEFALSDAQNAAQADPAGTVTPQVRRLGTRPEILAGLSSVATFLLLLVGVFAVDAIKREMSDPRSARSIARIQRAFRRLPKQTAPKS